MKTNLNSQKHQSDNSDNSKDLINGDDILQNVLDNYVTELNNFGMKTTVELFKERVSSVYVTLATALAKHYAEQGDLFKPYHLNLVLFDLFESPIDDKNRKDVLSSLEMKYPNIREFTSIEFPTIQRDLMYAIYEDMVTQKVSDKLMAAVTEVLLEANLQREEMHFDLTESQIGEAIREFAIVFFYKQYTKEVQYLVRRAILVKFGNMPISQIVKDGTMNAIRENEKDLIIMEFADQNIELKHKIGERINSDLKLKFKEKRLFLSEKKINEIGSPEFNIFKEFCLQLDELEYDSLKVFLVHISQEVINFVDCEILLKMNEEAEAA